MPPPGSQKRASMNGAVGVRGKDDACCGIFFLKYVLFIFNAIFWVSGLCVLGVGLWTLLDKHRYAVLLDSATYTATTYLLVVTGALILAMGFLGCVGAAKENTACLYIYASFLVLVFLLEAVAGILAYIYHATIHAELQRTFYTTMTQTYNKDSERTRAIDDLQQNFGCCGAANYSDWQDSVWLQNNPDIALLCPDSCCKTPATDCALRDHPSNINTDGCVTKLEYYIKDHLIILGAVGLGLCCLQIFGIVFACCLAKQVKDYNQRQETNMWQ